MKNCAFCGNKNLNERLTQYVYRHEGEFMIVNNVPCLECEYCGEQYFAAATLKLIEKNFKAIQSHKRKAKMMRVPVEEFPGGR
jgi:YgiT-type zinc finger domain-containing protein